MSEGEIGAIILFVIIGILAIVILACWISTEHDDMVSYSNMEFGDETWNGEDEEKYQRKK